MSHAETPTAPAAAVAATAGAAASSPPSECQGLAARVHPIRGALLDFPLEDSVSSASTGALEERRAGGSSSSSSPRASSLVDVPLPCGEYAPLAGEPASRGGAAGLRWRGRTARAGAALGRCAHALAAPVSAAVRPFLRLCAAVGRAHAWEQRLLARVCARRERLPWIGWLTSIWGAVWCTVAMLFFVEIIFNGEGGLGEHLKENLGDYVLMCSPVVFPFFLAAHMGHVASGLTLTSVLRTRRHRTRESVSRRPATRPSLVLHTDEVSSAGLSRPSQTVTAGPDNSQRLGDAADVPVPPSEVTRNSSGDLRQSETHSAYPVSSSAVRSADSEFSATEHAGSDVASSTAHTEVLSSSYQRQTEFTGESPNCDSLSLSATRPSEDNTSASTASGRLSPRRQNIEAASRFQSVVDRVKWLLLRSRMAHKPTFPRVIEESSSGSTGSSETLFRYPLAPSPDGVLEDSDELLPRPLPVDARLLKPWLWSYSFTSFVYCLWVAALVGGGLDLAAGLFGASMVPGFFCMLDVVGEFKQVPETETSEPRRSDQPSEDVVYYQSSAAVLAPSSSASRPADDRHSSLDETSPLLQP